MARVGRALPADGASAQSSASLQHRPDDDHRCFEIGRDRPRACADALGFDSRLVEKDHQGIAIDVQRASRDDCRKADVPIRLSNARRCIVPASGYYEWRTVEKAKQPYFISAADGAVLSIAGLWDRWKDPATGETISSATLIITAANDFTRCIHERMPVFLGQEDHDAWLTGKAGVEVLRSAPNDLLRMWPVSTRVNKSGQGDDDPSLIEAIEDEAIDRRG